MILRMDMILKRYSIIFKMKPRLAIIFFLITLLCRNFNSDLLIGFALAAETVAQLEAIKGEIISINEEHSFIIINRGRNDGVDIGALLDLYRDDEKIGKLKVVRVRDSIAAAEIIRIRPGAIIKVGDTVILLKEEVKEIREIEERKEVKITAIEKEVPYSKKLARAADIYADTEVVWFYLIQTLRDYGFIITDSNKLKGLLTARKNLELSLAKGIWADIRGNTDYETVLQVTTVSKEKERTRLTFEIEGSYNRGGKHQQFHIRRENGVYQEIEEIAERIKEQAER